MDADCILVVGRKGSDQLIDDPREIHELQERYLDHPLTSARRAWISISRALSVLNHNYIEALQVAESPMRDVGMAIRIMRYDAQAFREQVFRELCRVLFNYASMRHAVVDISRNVLPPYEKRNPSFYSEFLIRKQSVHELGASAVMSGPRNFLSHVDTAPLSVSFEFTGSGGEIYFEIGTESFLKSDQFNKAAKSYLRARETLQVRDLLGDAHPPFLELNQWVIGQFEFVHKEWIAELAPMENRLLKHSDRVQTILASDRVYIKPFTSQMY